MALGWVERGKIPDPLVRAGIRHLLRERLREVEAADSEAAALRLDRFVEMMDA